MRIPRNKLRGTLHSQILFSLLHPICSYAHKVGSLPSSPAGKITIELHQEWVNSSFPSSLAASNTETLRNYDFIFLFSEAFLKCRMRPSSTGNVNKSGRQRCLWGTQSWNSGELQSELVLLFLNGCSLCCLRICATCILYAESVSFSYTAGNAKGDFCTCRGKWKPENKFFQDLNLAFCHEEESALLGSTVRIGDIDLTISSGRWEMLTIFLSPKWRNPLLIQGNCTWNPHVEYPDMYGNAMMNCSFSQQPGKN